MVYFQFQISFILLCQPTVSYHSRTRSNPVSEALAPVTSYWFGVHHTIT